MSEFWRSVPLGAGPALGKHVAVLHLHGTDKGRHAFDADAHPSHTL